VGGLSQKKERGEPERTGMMVDETVAIMVGEYRDDRSRRENRPGRKRER
jgi:hypothetical protein